MILRITKIKKRKKGGIVKQNIKVAYAKLDPAHLFDGLFVPTKGAKREKGKDGILRRPRLIVEPRDFGGFSVGFQGFEQLGADDQSILLAITAQLGIDGFTIGNDPEGDISKKLRENFEFKGDITGDVGTKKTTLRSILMNAGYNPDIGTRIVKESLNRLRNTQIREKTSSGWDRTANLISTVFNEKSGEVYIAANPKLTKAIFHGQHVKISLFERNQLESEVAKILHAWLCSNVRPGGKLGFSGLVKIKSLIPHVWGPYSIEGASVKVACVKRGLIRDALDEIKDNTANLYGSYGWHIEVNKSEALILRPKDLPLIESSFTLPSAVSKEESDNNERLFWDSNHRDSLWQIYGAKEPNKYSVRKNPKRKIK